MATATVHALHIYPVKSCRAVNVDSSEVTARGLAGDRLFQVVDPDGAPVTQRQHPKMAAVRPAFDNGALRLEADGQAPIQVALPADNDVTVSSLLGIPVEAADAGDEAATWFSTYLGSPVRLVAMTDHSDYRIPGPGYDIELSWADGSSVLVANATSLNWLTDRAEEAFDMDRFRPNITVEAEAWTEDTWRDFSIGEARFGFGLAWPRCAIPQVDQTSGNRTKEPARVLKAHRWCTTAASAPESLRGILEGNALFGIGCSVLEAGATIAVGDTLTVHETGERIIAEPAD